MFNENFDIDVSYIWRYECIRFNHYECNDKNYKALKNLFFYLQNFYDIASHGPFLKFSDIESGKCAIDDYEITNKNYLDFINDVMPINSGIFFTYFKVENDFYYMNQPCIVKRKDLNKLDFEELFALKLRQYHDGLSWIGGFLNYQLKNNFSSNIKSFKTFLKYLLQQHEELIDKKIIKLTNDWVAETKLIFAEKSSRRNANDIKKEKSKNGTDHLNKPNESLQDIDGSENSSKANGDNINVNENNIPNGYKEIKGNLSLEEIKRYFSFLYLEKSDRGEPFLTEKDVKEIFRYGIAIPPSIHIQKFKLNCTKAFPKSLIEFCIYKFYEKHSRSISQKVDILEFFSFYFQDFEMHGQSKEKLLQWSKNVTGEKPLRMKIDIEEYLPTKTKTRPVTNPSQ
jgi:hypothetical protein